jgi:hypothetical protein
MLAGFIVFLLFVAFILALWEIQIEGGNGWAANLPTWRIAKGWPTALMGGRPLTGYHVFMIILLVSLVHLPLFFVPWTWRLEGLLIGFYLGMGIVEDFFWFVLNPHYGIKNFRKGKIWWHQTWWGPVPSIYWILITIAGILFYLGRSSF